MIIAALAAVTLGVFATTMTLWFTGFASVGAGAAERLSRIRGLDEKLSATAPQGGLSLRKRASLNFGGINLVSANVVQKWTVDLQRAGLTLNVREFFILRVVVAIAIAAMLMLVLPLPQLGLLGAPVGYLAVGMWLSRRINSRRKKLEAQLSELLQMLASGLRAGFGLLQAMESAGDQLPAPISVEIRRTMRDTAMGASVEQALASLNERVGSPDFDIVITAIMIQRSVGGNLAEILDNVANTMRERERIRGEINTLTSQQRMTGYVIGGIPIGLGAVFFVISPDFMKVMFTDSWGHMMLGGAAFMEFLGFMVIRKIVNIEV
ncbi:MAG: type II secretion system F family protein [Dehalococcoidia bacterium]|nr:type II secretion system F family protein [Dehalococcoidia bacterium]